MKVAFWNTAWDNEETPPEQRFSKIVRVPSVAPEASFAEFALFGVRIGDVLFKLGITHCFKEKAHAKHSEAKIVCPFQARSGGEKRFSRRPKYCVVDADRQWSLKHEYEQKAENMKE